MYRFILFDLDGTLTDPKEGICRSVQHALERSGRKVPEIDRLTPFIGPPLKDSFMEFCHMDEAQAQQAVADYRERYRETGWRENLLYPGIDVLLAHCRRHGARLAVASSKPQVFVEKILRHFGLRKYFDVVVGSELDGTRVKKEEVVQEALRQLYAKYGRKMTEQDRREQTVMVGDRKYDVEGAGAVGVDAIGVAYGYAQKGELAQAGAAAIAGTVEELEELLLGGRKRGTEKDIRIKPVPAGSFAKAIYMVSPFAVYFLLYEVIYVVCCSLFEALTGVGQQDLQKMLHDAEGIRRNYAVLSGTWLSVMIHAGTAAVLFLFYKGTEPLPWTRKDEKSRSGVIRRDLLIVFLGMLFSMGFNILLSRLASALAPLFLDEEKLQAFFQKAQYEHMTPLLPGTVLLVFVTPLLEEMVFRWLLLNRISRVFSIRLAALITALFFGFYHGNLLQGFYAFLMGLVLAQLCVGEECVLAPYLFHVAANAVIFWGGFLPQRVQDILTMPLMSVLYLGLGLVFYKILSKSMPEFYANRQ